MQIVEQEFNIVQEFPAGSQEPVGGAGRSKELPQVSGFPKTLLNIFKTNARNYRHSFRENKPKTLVFND